MAGVLGKFLEYIGIEENGADDEVYEDVNYEDESRDNNVVNFGTARRKTCIANQTWFPSPTPLS